MPRYELWESDDQCERSLSEAGQDANPAVSMDNHGRPMRVVAAFEASDWEDAKRMMREILGWPEPPAPSEVDGA
jgi:hypothetical protein